MENFRELYAKIQRLRNFKVQKIGSNFVCEKGTFCKSGHILAQNTSDLTVPMVKIIYVPTTVYLGKLHVHPNPISLV